MATVARRRNRRGEGAQLRGDIVRAAGQLLDEGGTERDVTLRAVARKVGISAPSIYPHFAHVDAILLAVAEDAFEALRGRLREALDREPPPDAAAAGTTSRAVLNLFAVCEAYLAFAAGRPHQYRVMFAGVWDARGAVTADPALADRAAALGGDAFSVLVDAVSRCVAAGRSSSRDPSADATAVWVGLHGLAGLQQAAPMFPWPPRLADELVTRLALVLPPPGASSSQRHRGTAG